MKTTRYKMIRLLILGMILLGLLIFAAFQAIGGSPGLAAGVSPNNPAAISPAQSAAIEGANQLLLLQPFYTQAVYLPMIER